MWNLRVRKTAPVAADGNTPPVVSPREEVRPNDRPIIIRESMIGKLCTGLFCSSVVAIVMNFANLKWLVIHLFAFCLSLFGKDDYIVKPTDALKQTAEELKGKLKGEVGKLPVSLGAKTPEQLKFEAEQKEAERKRRDASETETLLARAGLIAFPCDKSWPLERLRVEVTAAEKRCKEESERQRLIERATKLGLVVDKSDNAQSIKARVDEAEEKAAEELKKKPLLQRADKIGFVVNPTLDYRALRHEVEEAEKDVAADAEYQAKHRQWEEECSQWRKNRSYGKYGLCNNPRCRNVLEMKGSMYVNECSNCGSISRGDVARTLYYGIYPPKEPEKPKRNASLLWKVFH